MSRTHVRRILIAPLDWGLGHTTRCIAIIRRLLELKREVIFAGNDVQKTFVAAAFPGIPCLDLPGYGVKYSAGLFLPNLLRQIPKILRRIRQEHRWLQETVLSERIDAVISDNRYGLWHRRIPTVILTHQAGVITGLGPFADTLVRRLHYRVLERFTQCWLVDLAGEPNLSGALAHPPALPANARYIGWLSQLSPPQRIADDGYVLILLSGPEPQRSMLADTLWTQACALPERQFVFVEGREDAVRQAVPAHIRHVPRATTAQLEGILAGALIVVCRSGYSSLMDLALFGKPAILVPTPGQTEQEYLARRLETVRAFKHVPQPGFNLDAALWEAAGFPFQTVHPGDAHEAFEPILNDFLATLT